MPKEKNSLIWATVPDPIVNGESVITLEGDNAVMPLWYWNKVISYIIDTEKNIKILTEE